MVLLHVKRSEQDQFLYEAKAADDVKSVAFALATIQNLRNQITRLKLEGDELAKYGPAKAPGSEGIDSYSEAPVEKGDWYNQDPTGRRCGNACSPQVAGTLSRTLDEAVATASTSQVSRKVCLTKEMLMEAIDNIRGAVMIAYPMGLPEYDFIRQCLEGTDDVSGTNFGGEDLDPETTCLWFAGKLMLPEKKLSDYLGKNERTKAIIKMQKKGQGPPGREAPVDQDTQKAMMAWYYKKQEEEKKLQQDQDDSYTNASWANPKSLKAHFSGLSTIRLPK